MIEVSVGIFTKQGNPQDCLLLHHAFPKLYLFLHLLLVQFPPQVSFFLSVNLTDFKLSLSNQVFFVKSEFLEGLLVPNITKFIFDSLKIFIFNDKAAFYCVNFNQSFLNVLVYQQLK